MFEERPWLVDAAPRSTDVVGMLGRREASLFFHLARDYYVGQGTIVDAGSFLGRSAMCFAAGMRANPGFDAGRDRIHCFDNFICHDDNSIDHVKRGLGAQVKVGQSMRDLFDRQVEPARDLLVVHDGDFLRRHWEHGPIEILMVDIAKSADLGRHVVQEFFPALLPGRSVVIQQDYHHPWLPHIHVMMESLAECFRMVMPRVDV